MEEMMDVDQVVEVPDTPDRMTARHISSVQLGKESGSDVAGPSGPSDFRNKEYLNQPVARSRLRSENGFNKRNLHLNSERNPVKIDELDSHNRRINFSLLRNSLSSQNTPLFRRGSVTNDHKGENRHSVGMQQLDKGKPEFTNNPSKLPVHIDDDVLFDMAFPRGAPKTQRGEVTRDIQGSSNRGPSLNFPSEIRSSAFKGKEKVGVNAGYGLGSPTNRGRGIDLTKGSPHLESTSRLSAGLPRVAGHKRLVRNGCISPHNIASRPQKVAEIVGDDSTDVGKDESKRVSDGKSEIDIRDIVSGEKNDGKNGYRAKGKGLAIYPYTSTEHDRRVIHVSTSSRSSNLEANETSGTSRDASSGGWRTTHNHANNIYHANDERLANEKHETRGTRGNNRIENVTSKAHDSGDKAQAASALVSGLNQSNQPLHIGNIHTKRQKKHGFTSRSHTEHSPSGSEVMVLGSSEESSSPRSSRTLNRRHLGVLHPIYEIDESLPERMIDNSQDLDSASDDAAAARARQLEADEMLARELQEQLYQESPIFGGSEFDEDAAWTLQQEEDIFPAASSHYPIPGFRRAASVRANRHPQLRSSQNSSSRRGTSRLPASRTSQLRNRFFDRPSGGLSRARNHSVTSLTRSFPLDMDLDMRLDILEALEDMSMTNTRILQLQRDFNEDDYEMLLALDENNHQHGGASVDRINSLPESVVQTDNFEEACAICLETPTTGETIRHLPCLHKFHKECIDPWLRRRTSCPVCKSSVT